MEENASRALMIGAGIFMTVIVVSALLTYVYIAKEMSNSATSNLPNRGSTVESIEDISKDIEVNCYGIDFINFLRRITFDENIEVKIVTDDETIDIKSGTTSFDTYVENEKIKESLVVRINPNESIAIKKQITDDGYVIKSKYIVECSKLFYEIATI